MPGLVEGCHEQFGHKPKRTGNARPSQIQVPFPPARFTRKRQPLSGLAQIARRSLALLARLDFKFNLVALTQFHEAGPLNFGDVDEHVLRAILGLDETKTLGRVEPLYGTDRHRLFQ